MTSVTTRTAPTGQPRTFDNRPLAGLPEYRLLQEALTELGCAVDRAENPISRAEWVQAIADAARVAYAGDCCRGDNDHSDSFGPICWPYAAEVNGRWMVGDYHCHECGAQWTCGYSTDFSLWGDA